MKTKVIDKLAWVLVFSGLLLASLGVFLRSDSLLGWALIAVGALEAVAGVALIVLRSRMPP